MLRAAQNASVASNHSSVSGTGLPENTGNNHIISGPSQPGPSPRPGAHNRSSSSTSNLSRPRAASQVSISGLSLNDSNPSRFPGTSTSLSRQNSNMSTASSRRSEVASPGHYNDFSHQHYQTIHLDRRQSLSRRDTGTSNTAQYTPSASGSEQPLTSIPTTGRYEEVAYWKNELQKQKEENEKLRQRIRDLEAVKRGRMSMKREDSLDTNLSVQGSVCTPTRAAKEPSRLPKEVVTMETEIKAGESAASAVAAE